jgi:hypothetical protein
MSFGLGCVDRRLAGLDTDYLSAPKDIKMRIPDRLTKCAGFISHDLPTLDFIGTVFIVGIHDGVVGNALLHLVTAKHVAEVFDPGSCVIALNGKDGLPLFPKLGDDIQWFYHPTEPNAVDVAVAPFASERLNKYDIEWIPEEMFATPERIKEFGLGLGDELVAIGLFTGFYGHTAVNPIVRTGNLAMMPADRVPVKDFDPMEVYLAEGRSIGGLSGSPIFARNTVNLQTHKPVKYVYGRIEMEYIAGLGRLHFLGLMHGHWDVELAVTKVSQAEAVNMGISIIVPAHKILETLYHPELVKLRTAIRKEKQNDKLPTPDVSKTKAPGRDNDVFTRADFEAALKKASHKIKSKD